MSDSFDMTRVDNRSEKLTNEFNDILDEFKKKMQKMKLFFKVGQYKRLPVCKFA